MMSEYNNAMLAGLSRASVQASTATEPAFQTETVATVDSFQIYDYERPAAVPHTHTLHCTTTNLGLGGIMHFLWALRMLRETTNSKTLRLQLIAALGALALVRWAGPLLDLKDMERNLACVLR